MPGVPVTWVVDPAVLGPGGADHVAGTLPAHLLDHPPPLPDDTARRRHRPDEVSAAAVTAEAEATVTTLQRQLAARLAGAATRHPLWALPYADPDLAATLVSPSDPLVREAVDRAGDLTTRLGGVPVTTGVAWPVDGALPSERESGLRTAYGTDLRGALVSSSTLPSSDGLSATSPHLSPGGLPARGVGRHPEQPHHPHPHRP